jgi:lipopolysaccharide transport system permease protein
MRDDNQSYSNAEDSTVQWDLVIKGKSSLFDLKFREIWQYRDLLGLFVKRDFVSFYKQTVLGPLWFFIQPLFTTVVFTFVFGRLAAISTDGLPHALFYLSGITAWNYFSDCLIKTSTVFKDNANIFGKVYFPRLIMPLSIIVSNLVRFGVQLLLLFGLMAYYAIAGSSVQITPAALLLPLLIMMMAILGLGLGLIITAVTTKYKDLTFLVSFGVQLLMYATTIIYPLSAAPQEYKKYIMLNPMTAIVEAFRYALLGRGAFNIADLLYSLSISIIILLCGILIFNKTERNFVDTI